MLNDAKARLNVGSEILAQLGLRFLRQEVDPEISSSDGIRFLRNKASPIFESPPGAVEDESDKQTHQSKDRRLHGRAQDPRLRRNASPSPEAEPKSDLR